jgi:hypothetical protein
MLGPDAVLGANAHGGDAPVLELDHEDPVPGAEFVRCRAEPRLTAAIDVEMR